MLDRLAELPAPRLLTTVPMGGRVGTTVEVTVSGELLEEAGDLKQALFGLAERLLVA